MTLDEKLRALQASPLCLDLHRPQIRRLAVLAVERGFGAGETIFSEGEPARGLYLILSGRARIFKLSAQGREQILNVFGPGQTLGEAAGFAGGAYPANAEALEDTRALWIARDRFVRLLAAEPRIALGLLSVMSRRLQHFARMVDELSLQDVPSRLARFLLDRADPKSGLITLGMTKGDLAQRLGTVPETLSRALAKLTQRGLIRSRGQHLRLLDAEGLRDVVEEGRLAPPPARRSAP